MSIMSLWQPILASAVLAFIAGSVIWMAMPWHKTDWSRLADEDAVRNALKGNAAGQYNIPNWRDQADLKSPELQQKYKDGPVAFITVLPSGQPSMGLPMLLMFGYNLLVSIVCAYFVSRTLAPGADYLAIFRIAGTVAFISYGMAYIQESVWFGRPWSSTLKLFLDAAIYAGVVGGAFGWLS